MVLRDALDAGGLRRRLHRGDGGRRPRRRLRGIELVAPRSPDALADCLRRLLGDRTTRRELGELARATVEREFTWRRCGEQTLAAYEAALQ
jgi:glycosyltransferase involved in cell wall biosynthesis